MTLQIQAICREHTPRGIRSALASLPMGLNDTYTRIFENIQTMKGESGVRTAYAVLKWVLYSDGLISPWLVIDALRVTPGEQSPDTFKLKLDTVLDTCQNLVVLDDNVSVLRFAHFSVQEFLIQYPGFEPESAHSYITEVCLTALMYQPRVRNSLASILFFYSTYSWGYHLRLAGGDSKILERLWKQFLAPPLRPSQAYLDWTTSIARYATNNRPGTKDAALVPYARAITSVTTHLAPSSGVIAPVFVACFYQLCDVTEFLLDSGGSLECRNRYGDTPLTLAVRTGRTEFVRFLLGRNDVNLNPGGNTPLCVAVSYRRPAILELLLAKEGVDLNHPDQRGESPLLVAARNGDEEITQMLLATDGVDLGFRDGHGETAIVVSAAHGHTRVVETLLRGGVAPDVRGQHGLTPLSYAARNGHVQVVQALLGTGLVDVNSRDELGRTPLSYAAATEREANVEMLLDKGADMQSLDNDGWAPLPHAIAARRDGNVQILLDRGADIRSDWTRMVGHHPRRP